MYNELVKDLVKDEQMKYVEQFLFSVKHFEQGYCHRYHTGQQSLITQEIKDESSGYFYLFFLLMLGYID